MSPPPVPPEGEEIIVDLPSWRSKSPIPQAPMHIREPQPIRCYLFLTNDLIRIDCQRPMPNFWVRFWLKALLGWRWERPQ